MLTIKNFFKLKYAAKTIENNYWNDFHKKKIIVEYLFNVIIMIITTKNNVKIIICIIS